MIIVLCTCSTFDKAENMAKLVVQEQLVACATIINGKSIYFWDNQLQSESEFLILMKTSERAYKQLEQRLSEIHDYDIPEILALPVSNISTQYLNWLSQNIKS